MQTATHQQIGGIKDNCKPNAVSKVEIAMPSWRIYCFGKMKFMCNGRVLDGIRWKRKKTQELFLYLRLQANYEASRDRVVEALFGNSDSPEKLSNRLYVAIYELRQAAMEYLRIPKAVIVKEGRIRLSEQMIEYLDVEQYMALVRVGEQLWRTDWDLAYEMFEKAVQLYDDLLPEISYIDWLDQYRDHLTEKQSVILQRLTKQSVLDKRFEQAKWYAEQWLRIQPLQEEAHYTMIQLLLQEGKRSDALHRYQLWEQICYQELGVAPSEYIKGLIMGNVQ